MTRPPRARAAFLALVAGAAAALPALGLPDYDFDWVTIGDVGNAAYTGIDEFGVAFGRGAVNHAYRIARMEVTTAQWVEFVDAAHQVNHSFATLLEPSKWGGDIRVQGGQIVGYKVKDEPNAGMRPVDGLDWQDGARFVNWLHNGKAITRDAFETGVYDTSKWVVNPNDGSVSGVQRETGARFWIPTLDEWMKAAHYDPNKHGNGQGGWWLWNNQSDTAGPVSGLPGVGETLAGLGFDDALWDYALGSFPDVTSAYGLLDLSGGAPEFNEDLIRRYDGDEQRHYLGGSGIGFPLPGYDQIGFFDDATPLSGNGGFRIASAVPGPGAALAIVPCLYLILQRRRGSR